MGGFSRSFDLLSSEYGWTDEQILDIPVRRLRQIVVSIETRRFIEDLKFKRIAAWQTRTLAVFISSTIEVEKGKENTLLTAAQRIALDEGELKDLTVDIPKEEPPSEPAVGSYERLMRGFAGG